MPVASANSRTHWRTRVTSASGCAFSNPSMSCKSFGRHAIAFMISKSSTRGTGDDHVPVLVVRDRSGASTDFILGRSDKAQLTAVLTPVLAPDVVLCTDGSSALAAAARHIGLTHQALNMSSGPRTRGPWHIQNVNAYHGRLKEWMRRFHGVATSYLASYLGWFRALDRSGSTSTEPACLLALALGNGTYP